MVVVRVVECEVGAWAGLNGRAAGCDRSSCTALGEDGAATGSVRGGRCGGECWRQQGPLHPVRVQVQGDGGVEIDCTGDGALGAKYRSWRESGWSSAGGDEVSRDSRFRWAARPPSVALRADADNRTDWLHAAG